MQLKYLWVCIMLLGLSVAGNGQVRIGAFVGVNTAQFRGDVPYKLKYKPVSGLDYGLVGEFSLTSDVLVSVRPSFTSMGSTMQVEDKATRMYQDSVVAKLKYFSVPVQLKVMTPNQKLFFSGGVCWDVKLKEEVTVLGEGKVQETIVNDHNLSAILGLGYRIPMGQHGIDLEFNYFQGLLNLTEDEDEGYFPRIKSQVFQFRVVYTFALKKQNP